MDEQPPEPTERALDADQRRVLGVLVEKAKTTPDAYPLSLNALRTGCNQKSNRFPQVDFTDERVESAIESLREKKAVSIVQGDSRVERFRHLAYDWLGVDKVQLAVMAELMLRGAQSVGDLRGRAARMEPIKGVAELTPVLRELCDKGLAVYLTPPGRGAVISHTFYSENELARVRRDLGLSAEAGQYDPGPTAAESRPAPSTNPTTESQPASQGLEELRTELMNEIQTLRAEIESIKQKLD